VKDYFNKIRKLFRSAECIKLLKESLSPQTRKHCLTWGKTGLGRAESDLRSRRRAGEPTFQPRVPSPISRDQSRKVENFVLKLMITRRLEGVEHRGSRNSRLCCIRGPEQKSKIHATYLAVGPDFLYFCLTFFLLENKYREEQFDRKLYERKQ
jgi:hypothetical protein